MEILLLEPFMGESHKAWAEGYARHSRHRVIVMGLPGRHWKWRMHGAAETFARQFMEQELKPDLILATDMLDLSAFLALTRKRTAGIPVAFYFHENQLAYPWSPTDPDPKLERDNHYAYINYRSALVADRVFWNSRYNLESFLGGLDGFLKAFPDFQEVQNVALIREKSRVLPLGVDLPQIDGAFVKDRSKPPLLIWNHRWEYDKAPELFFETLFALSEEGGISGWRYWGGRTRRRRRSLRRRKSGWLTGSCILGLWSRRLIISGSLREGDLSPRDLAAGVFWRVGRGGDGGGRGATAAVCIGLSGAYSSGVPIPAFVQG
ncbi:MAG: DUF3524 domain-containing protein [Bacteroidia bacterium]